MNIDQIVFTSQFGTDKDQHTAHKDIRSIALEKGVRLVSIQPLYHAIGRGEIGGFTVPSINIRTLTYDFAQTIFLLVLKHEVGPVVFEIALSEQEYTAQPPMQFASSILAAAIKTGYTGPVFIQGDHYQFKREKYQTDQSAELKRVKSYIKESIGAGFYNIDIDGSTLVDLEKSNLLAQQHENYTVTAAMTDYIRSLQPAGVIISVGGEIGHIGGKNSTVEDFQAFMKGYKALLSPGSTGISKVSVQTGTHHGGVVQADGTLAHVPVDFAVLKTIGETARSQYGIGGAVQHGASTLSDDLFHSFPENGTLEIHLSTGFQNIIYDNMPAELREKIYTWLRTEHTAERTPDMTDEQFIYTTRKKAWGAFKQDMWELDSSSKRAILHPIEHKLSLLFQKLRINHTRHLLEKYVV